MTAKLWAIRTGKSVGERRLVAAFERYVPLGALWIIL